MRCTARMYASARSLHVHKQRISPRHTNIASPTAIEHISSSINTMPRDQAAVNARSKRHRINRRATPRARTEDEQGNRVPEGTGEVEDSSDSSSAEEAGTFNHFEYLTLN
jgi:hypothetical protein